MSTSGTNEYIIDEWTDEREVGALGFQLVSSHRLAEITSESYIYLEMRVENEDGKWSEWKEEDLDGLGDDLLRRLPCLLEETILAAREGTLP